MSVSGWLPDVGVVCKEVWEFLCGLVTLVFDAVSVRKLCGSRTGIEADVSGWLPVHLRLDRGNPHTRFNLRLAINGLRLGSCSDAQPSTETGQACRH